MRNKRPFKIVGRDGIIGYHPKTKKPIRGRIIKQDKTFAKYFLWFVFFWLVFGFLLSCSYQPIIDSRGKSSANIEGSAERMHDDLYTCKDIVKDNTNSAFDNSKKVYNALRWRVLWISPKLETSDDLLRECLEGRGHNVLN